VAQSCVSYSVSQLHMRAGRGGGGGGTLRYTLQDEGAGAGAGTTHYYGRGRGAEQGSERARASERTIEWPPTTTPTGTFTAQIPCFVLILGAPDGGASCAAGAKSAQRMGRRPEALGRAGRVRSRLVHGRPGLEHPGAATLQQATCAAACRHYLSLTSAHARARAPGAGVSGGGATVREGTASHQLACKRVLQPTPGARRRGPSPPLLTRVRTARRRTTYTTAPGLCLHCG
jgi:hypothetical protein